MEILSKTFVRRWCKCFKKQDWSTENQRGRTSEFKALVGLHLLYHQIIAKIMKVWNKKYLWVPSELVLGQMKMRISYVQSRQEHALTVERHNLISITNRRRIKRENDATVVRNRVVAVSTTFGIQAIIVIAINIRCICYATVLAKSETMNAASYLEFLKRLVDL